MWSFSFELSFSHTLRNLKKKVKSNVRNTLKQFFNWSFGPHVLVLKLLINASGLIVIKLFVAHPPKGVKNTKRTIFLIIIYISYYWYTQFSKTEFHMAFKFLVLKIVVSNTPSKISMMKKPYIAGNWGNFLLLLCMNQLDSMFFP